MTSAAHLWAVGYDDTTRAEQVRDEIVRLAWGAGRAGKYLILEDIAVVVRHPDGHFTFDRKPFPGLANILTCTGAGFLAGLVLAAPLTGATPGSSGRQRRLRRRRLPGRQQRGLHPRRRVHDEAWLFLALCAG
jgi:uncharacterized membrane protein